MSVFYVVQWSVNPPDQEACGQAMNAVAEHVKSVHPAAKSFRAYRQTFGRLPQLTYFAVGEPVDPSKLSPGRRCRPP